MTKNNNLIPTNKAPIETVYEIKNYEIKKSLLSPAARGKVINKSGGNYVSESKSDYGPCEYWDCPYSTNCRFYIKMGFDGGDLRLTEKNSPGGWFIFKWLTMKNVAQARDALRRFENPEEIGGYRVEEENVFWSSSKVTQYSERNQDEVKDWLRSKIRLHEGGKEVYITRKDFYDDYNGPSCSLS